MDDPRFDEIAETVGRSPAANHQQQRTSHERSGSVGPPDMDRIRARHSGMSQITAPRCLYPRRIQEETGRGAWPFTTEAHVFTRLMCVTVHVIDQDRTLAFYGDLLGQATRVDIGGPCGLGARVLRRPRAEAKG